MSNIKINDVPQRIQYSATNGQTQFAIPFPFFDNDYVIVWQDGVQIFQGGAAGQYGISGAGSPSGGLITLVTPAILDSIITIQGDMPIDRTSIYSATISNLTGSDLNGDFNREVVMMKQIQTTQAFLQLQYAPWALVSQDVDVTVDRYIPQLGAKQIWRMNDTRTEIEPVTMESPPAPLDAYYLTYSSSPTLTHEQNLALLGNGLLKQSVTTGIATLQNAIAATDYWAPGNALTRSQSPVNSDDVTNKAYVDAVAQGFYFVEPVRAATTANFSSTYDNGVDGVGATLTGTSNGAASIDGVSLNLNDRVLFQFQTTAYENGIYIVTQVGDGSSPPIYTRASDYDEPVDIDPGDFVLCLEGTSNKGTGWVEIAIVNNIGIDSINFTEIVSRFIKSINVQVFTSSGTYTATSGMAYAHVKAIGGGAAGGGTPTTGLGVVDTAGGGGGGSYAEAIFSAATIGASQTVTIGAGGLGVVNNTGNSGGTTSFGSLLSCPGGNGGGYNAVGSTGFIAVNGGAGGSLPTGGNVIATPGARGGYGVAGTTNGSSLKGGNGAAGINGGGGGLGGQNIAGSNGVGYGDGGGGASAFSSVAARAGGNGSSGYLAVIEYIV